MKLLLVCLSLLVAQGAMASDFTVDMSLPLPHFVLTPEQLDTLARVMREEKKTELRVQLVPSPCEQQLEAAMRAMEPYISQYQKDGTIWYSAFKGAPYEIAKQWDAAKGCWKGP